MNIRSKFILILFFSLAALGAILCTAVRFYAIQDMDAAFLRKASAQLDRIDDIIHIYFKGAEQAVKNLATMPEVGNIALSRNADAPDADPASTREAEKLLLQRLSILPKAMPEVETAFCGYKNGSFHSSADDAPPAGYDARTQAWYSDTAWGLADTSITNLTISQKSKSLIATLAAKIKNNSGDTLGVVALVMSLGSLTDTLRDIRLGRSGHVVLFDAEGHVLFDPNAQENLLRPAAETNSLLHSLAQLPAGQHTLSHDGVSLLALSRIFPDTRWKGAILLSKDEQISPANTTLQNIMLITGISSIVLWGLGILFAFGATRPLHALVRQSKALAEGNDNALAAIAGRGPDIAALQSNLGQLTGRVMLLAQAERHHAAEIESYTRKIAAAEHSMTGKSAQEGFRTANNKTAQALAPFTADITNRIADITEWTRQLQMHADVHTAAAYAAKTAICGLTDDTARIALQATETEKNAEAALSLVRKTDNQLRDSFRSAESLEDAVQKLAPGLNTFKIHAEDMAISTTAVRDVAEEINVLGLKLSIEISNAGDGGKKFAPFAEEMRQMAERAMASVAVMDNVIATLDQTHTAQTLAVNKNTAACNRISTNSAKVNNAFMETAAAVATVTEQINILATALEGISQTPPLENEQLDAIGRAEQEMANAFTGLNGAVASLESFATRLASLTNELETATENEDLLPAEPRP